MAHEYSVDIHEWIKEKIDSIKADLKNIKDSGDTKAENYYNGQLHQLMEIRQYLTDHIDLDTQTYYQ